MTDVLSVIECLHELEGANVEVYEANPGFFMYDEHKSKTSHALLRILRRCAVAIDAVLSNFHGHLQKPHHLAVKLNAMSTAIHSIDPLGFGKKAFLHHKMLRRICNMLDNMKDAAWLDAVLNNIFQHAADASQAECRSYLAASNTSTTNAEKDSELVTQECAHDEPPVAPDATDEKIVDAIWATGVEQHINTSTQQGSASSSAMDQANVCELIENDDEMPSSDEVWTRPTEYGVNIILLKFTRCGQLLRKALHEGTELEPVRAAAKEQGRTCQLRSGASIFVYPNQYDIILSVLPDTELRPHHVIACEAFLPFIYHEIKKLPSRSNVRPSSSRTVALVEGDTAESICIVERTFLSNVSHHLCEPDSVTQSTSELRHVLNVRRRRLYSPENH